MATNPYDLEPWWSTASGGASGGVYDTVITTNINAGVRGQAVAQAGQAAAQAARNAAIIGATSAVIVMQARMAAQSTWNNVTGGAGGNSSAGTYQASEPGIFDYAASVLNLVSSAATPVADNASAVAASALKVASATGIGALFGGAGTAVLIGAGALILLVLLKR